MYGPLSKIVNHLVRLGNISPLADLDHSHLPVVVWSLAWRSARVSSLTH